MTPIELITSTRNPKVLSWRALKDKKGRDEQQSFLVEGPKMTGEALSSGFPVHALLLREGYTPPFPVPSSVPSYTLSDNVFQAVCETKTP